MGEVKEESVIGNQESYDSKPEGDHIVFTRFPKDPKCDVGTVVAGTILLLPMARQHSSTDVVSHLTDARSWSVQKAATHPMSSEDESRLHQFDKKMLLGRLKGHVLRAVRGCSGDLLIADCEELENLSASEMYDER